MIASSAEENSVKVIGGGARNPATANGLKEKASKSRIFREKLSACAGGASERRYRPLPSTEAGKRRATGTREKGREVFGARERVGAFWELGVHTSHGTPRMVGSRLNFVGPSRAAVRRKEERSTECRWEWRCFPLCFLVIMITQKNAAGGFA